MLQNQLALELGRAMAIVKTASAIKDIKVREDYLKQNLSEEQLALLTKQDTDNDE
jgi:hypothetical protein